MKWALYNAYYACTYVFSYSCTHRYNQYLYLFLGSETSVQKDQEVESNLESNKFMFTEVKNAQTKMC